MKRGIFRIIAILTALASGVACSAFYTAPNTAYFKVTDMSSGLPDNSVNDITEDPYGFIWLATWDGVARFDGRRIDSFQPSGSEKMPGSNMTRALLAQNDGIWIGADGGLYFLRFRDNKFIPAYVLTENGNREKISVRVSNIINVRGNIIIQTIAGNILIFDRKASNLKEDSLVFKIQPTPGDRIYSDIVPYSGGRIMAVSNEGITVLSSDAGRELMHNPYPRNCNGYTNLYCDTLRNRVFVGGEIGTKTEVYDIASKDGRLNPNHDIQIPSGVSSIISAPNAMYFATDGNGLYRLDDSGVAVSYIPNNSSIPCDALYSLFRDSKGNIWCGTYRHGVCMLSRDLNSYMLNNIETGTLSYNIVTAIVPDGNMLYVGLDGGGLDIIDRTTNNSFNLNKNNSSLPDNNIVSLVKDGDKLWAATYSFGLAEIDPRTHHVTSYPAPGIKDGDNKLWVIKDDNSGNLWVGTVGGLYLFNKQTHVYNSVKGCDNSSVMSLADDGKFMWVATRKKGVMKIDKRSGEIVARYSNSPTSNGVVLPTQHAVYVFVDSKRNLWVNLEDQGLYVMNADNPGAPRKFNENNGLLNPHVYSMVEDGSSNLWIGTNDGLYKYIRANNTFVRKKDSRIPLSYTHNASVIDGDLAHFGSTKGLLSFNLSEPPSLGTFHPIMFTSINIFDSRNTRIPLYGTSKPSVALESDQNFFTVSFTVPEMSNPDQMQFECRMEGLEDIWKDVTETRSATYTNVPGGKYRLLVRHTNPDGTWTEPAALDIRVKSPWYASVSMLLVWLALSCALVYGFFKIRRKFVDNKKMTERAEMEKDSASKLNEAKLDFYATISHELRTPCFLISAQLEEIMDSERQSIPVSSLQGIHRSSAKLNKLINHIIDFRKSDTGMLKLFARKVEMVTFLENLTVDYEQLCRQKNLQFSYVHDNPPIEAYVDPDKIEQIVTNLISNAYKYTPKGGSVTLSLRDEGADKIAIVVSDSGIGIMEKVQSNVFNPYYRTERGEQESKGDGIGLAFVKELVTLHKGTITLESEINKGSTFTVIIPKTHPQPVLHDAAEDEEVVPPNKHRVVHPVKKPVVKSIPNPTAIHSMLIIDDDPEVIDLVAHAFEGEYRVDCAVDGQQGVEAAKTGDYDVVITDIMMPEFDGHEVVKMLRNNRESAHTKIVVFSALASEKDMVQALDEGADTYILKPTPLKALRKQVDRLFEHSADPAKPQISSVSSGQYTREEQKFLRECRRIIDEHLTDEEFGVGGMAEILAMSHSSLYKKIRKMTGMSLIEFINDYKIYRAIEMFRNGASNVQKVSEACGFKDAKSFRESFKRKMKMPPKQFVSQLNNNDDY